MQKLYNWTERHLLLGALLIGFAGLTAGGIACIALITVGVFLLDRESTVVLILLACLGIAFLTLWAVKQEDEELGGMQANFFSCMLFSIPASLFMGDAHSRPLGLVVAVIGLAIGIGSMMEHHRRPRRRC